MAFSTRTMRAADWKKLRYFTPKEFTRPERMGYEWMLLLDEVRERAGVPMLISSSSRTKAHNAEVGGAGDSAHMDALCEAVDIRKNPKPKVTWNHDRYRIVKAAMDLGIERIGIYQDESIHLDKTDGRRPAPRLWIRV